MSRRAVLLGLAAAIAVAGVSADARMHHPYRAHRIIPANAAPLDGFTTPSAAYSFRKLRTAYVGPAIKLQRVDTTTQDIGFVGNDFDVASAAAFCTTACTINTWYDQSGNNGHMVQATAANQPAYVAACVGGKPCAQLGDVAFMNRSTVAGIALSSYSVVANRISGTGNSIFFRQNGSTGNRIGAEPGNNWTVRGNTSGVVATAAADNAWHVGAGVINGASSSITVDGVTAAGTATGGIVSGPFGIVGTASQLHAMTEVVVWNGYALTAPETAALAANQRDYWIPAPLDTFATPAGAYSFRKLKSTYSGPGMRLWRASDSAQQDINFLGFVPGLGAPFDTAAANAFCASTTCRIAIWYDQSGNGRNVTNAAFATNPALIFNCIGLQPCLRNDGNNLLQGPSLTPATGIASFSGVARVDTATIATCQLVLYGNVQLSTHASGPNWMVYNNVGSLFATGALQVFHAAEGVINGASSVLSIDGTETAGTVTANPPAAGNIGAAGGHSAGVPCSHAEAIAWDNYALSPAERLALQANQKNFWGTP